MNLLKLTIASGPEKGSALYVHADKICYFSPNICRAEADGRGKEKGSYIRLDNGHECMVKENVEDICKMLENSNGYLQITHMSKKD